MYCFIIFVICLIPINALKQLIYENLIPQSITYDFEISNNSFPKKFKVGTLLKNGKRDGITTYNLLVPTGSGEDDNIVFKDIVNLFNNPTQGAFTRTISLALRHDVPLHYVVEQLQKDKNSDMFSYARVIARVLKGYIKDGTKSTEKGCPSCGSSELFYQEGCLSCKSCGFSKCG
jgi:ribonucleoside-diphosphate reductase alpha chain